MGTSRVTHHDIREILGSEGVKERVTIDEIGCNFNAVKVNKRLLLIYIPHGKNVEAHICSPKKYWPFIHQDIKDSIKFLCGLGYNAIYTDVSDKFRTTQNLIKKHGFEECHRHGEEAVFKWVLK